MKRLTLEQVEAVRREIEQGLAVNYMEGRDQSLFLFPRSLEMDAFDPRNRHHEIGYCMAVRVGEELVFRWVDAAEMLGGVDEAVERVTGVVTKEDRHTRKVMGALKYVGIFLFFVGLLQLAGSLPLIPFLQSQDAGSPLLYIRLYSRLVLLVAGAGMGAASLMYDLSSSAAGRLMSLRVGLASAFTLFAPLLYRGLVWAW